MCGCLLQSDLAMLQTNICTDMEHIVPPDSDIMQCRRNAFYTRALSVLADHPSRGAGAR